MTDPTYQEVWKVGPRPLEYSTFRLTVAIAQSADSGVFSCTAVNGRRHSIVLKVQGFFALITFGVISLRVSSRVPSISTKRQTSRVLNRTCRPPVQDPSKAASAGRHTFSAVVSNSSATLGTTSEALVRYSVWRMDSGQRRCPTANVSAICPSI